MLSARVDDHSSPTCGRHARGKDLRRAVTRARFASRRRTGAMPSIRWQAGEAFVFGSESAGAPEVRDKFPL